jgi:hypothetical protein
MSASLCKVILCKDAADQVAECLRNNYVHIQGVISQSETLQFL